MKTNSEIHSYIPDRAKKQTSIITVSNEGQLVVDKTKRLICHIPSKVSQGSRKSKPRTEKCSLCRIKHKILGVGVGDARKGHAAIGKEGTDVEHAHGRCECRHYLRMGGD